MVLVKYFTFFCFAVGIIPFYCESNQFHNRSLYGTKINTSPKSSCLRFNNIHLVGLCLQTCMANVGIYYMLSYNKDQQACLCCTDFSGSEITDPSWKTYEIIFCYKGFDDKIARNCLKYIPEAITYPEAEARCRKDGGALFKVDSRTKFDILKEYIGPASAINNIETWIQAKKTAGNWLFDDGTAMRSDSCPFMNSNAPGEIRLRFNTKYLKCLDNSESTTYDYICEYMYMYHHLFGK